MLHAEAGEVFYCDLIRGQSDESDCACNDDDPDNDRFGDDASALTTKTVGSADEYDVRAIPRQVQPISLLLIALMATVKMRVMTVHHPLKLCNIR